MKKIYLSLSMAMLAGAASQLQAQCSTGRYATDVYTNITTTNDIVYGVNKTVSGTTQTLTLDFYQPTADTAQRRPLIIWAHGGSFIGGTKNDQDVSDLSMRLAKKGFVCASINYRLGFTPFDSTGVVPAVVRAVQDMKAAIRFFYKDRMTSNTYKIDTNNIFIGGSSAGAITALHTAYLDRTCEINTYINPTALAALGGIEGGSGSQCYSTKVKGVVNLCGALAKFYWFETGNIPLCSMHGTADPVVPYGRGKANPGIPIMYLDGSRWLYAQSQAAGIANTFYTWNGAGHVPYAGTSAAAIAYMDTTVKFVRDYLVTRIGCSETPLMPPNTPSTTVTLPSYTACTGNVAMPCDVGVQELNADLVQQIYPNPSNGDVTISFVNSGSTHYMSLTDVSGKLIRSESSTQDAYLFQKRDLAPGIYFMKVANAKGQWSVKKIIFY